MSPERPGLPGQKNERAGINTERRSSDTEEKSSNAASRLRADASPLVSGPEDLVYGVTAVQVQSSGEIAEMLPQDQSAPVQSRLQRLRLDVQHGARFLGR